MTFWSIFFHARHKVRHWEIEACDGYGSARGAVPGGGCGHGAGAGRRVAVSGHLWVEDGRLRKGAYDGGPPPRWTTAMRCAAGTRTSSGCGQGVAGPGAGLPSRDSHGKNAAAGPAGGRAGRMPNRAGAARVSRGGALASAGTARNAAGMAGTALGLPDAAPSSDLLARGIPGTGGTPPRLGGRPTRAWIVADTIAGMRACAACGSCVQRATA